jgi:hypothetical protein
MSSSSSTPASSTSSAAADDAAAAFEGYLSQQHPSEIYLKDLTDEQLLDLVDVAPVVECWDEATCHKRLRIARGNRPTATNHGASAIQNLNKCINALRARLLLLHRQS